MLKPHTYFVLAVIAAAVGIALDLLGKPHALACFGLALMLMAAGVADCV
jgi:hypothetical protein